MKQPLDSKVAIIGAARDIGDSFLKLFSVINSSFKIFREIQFFISENNSIDTTREILVKLSKENKNFNIILLEDDINLVEYKTERIARARNIALDAVIKSEFNPDYIAVLDLDHINLGLTSDSLLSCWNHNNWNAMFANQPEGYYDIYALRHNLWSPRDWLIDYFELEKNFGKKVAMDLSLNSKRIKIEKTRDLISVDSAFGGLGIYTFDEIMKTKYVGLSETGEPICEHLSVNLAIKKNGGNLFINPGLTNVRGYRGINKFKSRIYEKYIRKVKYIGID
jgi:hypothetical protein